MKLLEQILYPITLREFFEEYYDRKILHTGKRLSGLRAI